MPQSAISGGCGLFVPPHAAIARELARLGAHSYFLKQTAPASAPPPQEETSLRQIFTLLRNMSKIDLSQYQQSTIRRRLQRRMALAQVEKIEDYPAYLLKQKGELDSLLSDLLIKTTRCFRDG